MSEFVAEHVDNLANDIRQHLDGSGALAEVLLVGPTMARIIEDAEQRGAAKVTAAVETLAQWYDDQPNWREWGVGDSIRSALKA